MDAFDRFWQWANKPVESTLTIPADIFTTRSRRYRPKRGATALR
jgi:hypothetical protein